MRWTKPLSGTRYKQKNRANPGSFSRQNENTRLGPAGTLGASLIEEAVQQCATEMTWRCSACDMTFNSKAKLKNHMKGHLGQLGFSCEICSKKFWNMHDLEGHISAKHTNIKVHVCHLCGRSFSYRKTLVRHLKNGHTAMRAVADRPSSMT